MSTIELNESEQAVLSAASNIAIAIAGSNGIQSKQEAEKIFNRSLGMAHAMAKTLDRGRQYEGIVPLGGDDPGGFPW